MMKKSIPWQGVFAKLILKIYPFKRGRTRIANLIVPKNLKWPDFGNITFNFGKFIDAPLGKWPLGYRELYIFGEIEVNELKVWKKVLRNGGVVVDGGANSGYWSLVASKIVGKNGVVHSFEPSPITYKKLINNVMVSKANNIICHQVGLSDEPDVKTLCVLGDAEDPISGFASIGKNENSNYKMLFEIKVDKLSGVLGKNELIKLIKLDLEGAELNALKGAQEYLTSVSYAPIITFEWNRPTANALNYNPEEILNYLSGFGYHFFLAADNHLVPFDLKAQQTCDVNAWSPMVWGLNPLHQSELCYTHHSSRQ